MPLFQEFWTVQEIHKIPFCGFWLLLHVVSELLFYISQNKTFLCLTTRFWENGSWECVTGLQQPLFQGGSSQRSFYKNMEVLFSPCKLLSWTFKLLWLNHTILNYENFHLTCPIEVKYFVFGYNSRILCLRCAWFSEIFVLRILSNTHRHI